MKLIGLSLSFCIADVASSKVGYNDVECIITGVACRNDRDWKAVIEQYRHTYWQNISDARAWAEQFRTDHKLYQPRLDGHAAPNIAHGHWIEVGEEPRGTRPATTKSTSSPKYFIWHSST
jgi:hypothetical protein